jgi:hypothetical protein
MTHNSIPVQLSDDPIDKKLLYQPDARDTTAFLTAIVKHRENDHLSILAQKDDENNKGTPHQIKAIPLPIDSIDVVEIERILTTANSNQEGVFITTLTTNESGKRTAKEAIDPLAIIADYDGGKSAPTDEEFTNLDLPLPSWRVQSGGGQHCWWFLHESGVTKDQRYNIVEAIALKTEGDIKVKDCARYLRIPGSVHWKDPNNPKLVYTLEANPDRVYRFKDFSTSPTNAVKDKPTISTKMPSKKAGRPPLILPEVKEKVDSYNGQIPANLKSDLERQLSNIIKATDGNRNDKLRDASLALGRIGQNGLDRETAFELLVWSAEANGVYIDEPEQCKRTIKNGLDDGLNGEPWRSTDRSKNYKSISREPVSIKNLIIETFGQLYPEQSIRFNKRLGHWEIGGKVLSANEFTLKFGEAINYKFSTEILRDVALSLSIDETIAYDPIIEYLDSLKSNDNYRKPIGSNELSSLFSITETEARFLKRWLISACARAYQPGCKTDSVLLLKGEQGVGKSSFLKWLAGGDDYYHSGGVGGGDKDTTIANNLCWINEIEEVDRYTSKREASDIKTDISKTSDRVRKPYTAECEIIKRWFVFGASTNKDTPLVDDTNRRWLSINITKDIKSKLTSELRDKILAMALKAYDSGEQWWLDTDEEISQKEINKEYTEENIYSEKLIPAIDRAIKSNPRTIFLVDTCIEYLEERRSQKVRTTIKQVFKEYGLEQLPSRKNGRGYQLPKNHNYVVNTLLTENRNATLSILKGEDRT